MDTRLTAVASGHGADVVLVHGSLGDHRQWTVISERLQQQYRVVSLSRRYHWPNEPPAPDAVYSYESHCDDLVEYLRGRPGPTHLVGHSYGAGIALLAAVREPALVRTLTVIEAPFASLLPDAAPDLEQETADRHSMLATMQSLVRMGADEDAARTLIDWTQGGAGGFARLPLSTQCGLLENAKTIGPTFSVAPPRVTCGQLRELRVPTLVLNGQFTRLYYRLIGETIASCVPNASAAQIPHAGHMTIVERPDETAALMMTFLDEGAP